MILLSTELPGEESRLTGKQLIRPSRDLLSKLSVKHKTNMIGAGHEQVHNKTLGDRIACVISDD
jgi:hypothetical protein